MDRLARNLVTAMRTLIAAPQSIGLARKDDRPLASATLAPRTLRDTSQTADARRSPALLRPLAPTAPVLARDHHARDGQGVDAALLELQDLFFASCADYPADEQLQQRMRAHCRDVEASLRSGALRDWRSGRDCLLARLGFRLHPD